MKRLQKITKKAWVTMPLVVVMVAMIIMVPGLQTHAGGYNAQQAVAYAEQWSGSNRNPDYRNYSGADCMNYVSQCLRAGGLETGSDWQPYTASWVGCVSFVNAMRARGYQVIENPSADQIYPGNPVLFQWKGSSYEWSHATICVGYDGNGTPIVNGHTTDRVHVKWNYGASSARRMCTVLINDGSNNGGNLVSQLGSPVDIGNEFHAYIYNDMSGKVVTNDFDNVSIRTQGDSTDEVCRQVWKFVRQSDNSYFIYNCNGGKALDVCGAIGDAGTNVQVFNFWGEHNTAQRWEIYAKDGAYLLRPQVSDSCVLDVSNADTAEGTNIQIARINTSPAQRFQICKVNEPVVEEATTESTEEATTESTEEVATEPTEEAATEPTEEAATEPTEEATTEPTEEAATEPTEEVATEPTEEATTEPIEEVATEPTEEVATEPTEATVIAGNTDINVAIDNSTNNTFITFINNILGIEETQAEESDTQAAITTEAAYNTAGGSDNTDWCREEAQRRYDAGLQEGYEPVTVVEEQQETDTVQTEKQKDEVQTTDSADTDTTDADTTDAEDSADTDITDAEDSADTSITDTEDSTETADGIRLVTNVDENGRLKNLYLQIVFSINGTKQVYMIQLI